MLIKDPHYMRKLNIQKIPPTNENITLFKYMDVSNITFYVLSN